MGQDETSQRRIEIAAEYFRRVDSGDPKLIDLMTEDVQIYFPKFGVGYGKQAILEFAAGLMTQIATFTHDIDRMNFIANGAFVVVEGFESGTTKDGRAWPDPNRSEGRFCNVFEFDRLLIKRVHIYADPDFTSEDRARFYWGDAARLARPAPRTNRPSDAAS